MRECVLVFDFGGQYCHLIARRIRELSVYSEIVPPTLSLERLRGLQERFDVKGLIISGGPSSVYEEGAMVIDKRLLEAGIPTLGICYGHQMLAHLLGGKVERAEKGEFGLTKARILRREGVFEGLEEEEDVWMSHRDYVSKPPEGFVVAASTENSPVAAFAHEGKRIFGVQWHPEVEHTKRGMLILENFLKLCGCKRDWKVENLVDELVTKLRRRIRRRKAIIALSGGVDSSTAAVLAHRAVGERLTSVFVDTSLMREVDRKLVEEVFVKGLGMRVEFVDASEEFFERLRGVADPEEKRRIVGETFVRVFERVARRVGAEVLVQGTIYPDRIESGVSATGLLTERIKTHHNVGGLPPWMELEVVEPLRDFYKDEVRKLARLLGLPKELVERHPFPGPGLAVRIVGEVTPEKVKILRKVDAIVEEELRRAGLYQRLWQGFSVLLPVRTVGVQGDLRTYKHVVVLRCVESKDGMTANFSKLPWELLERISTRITNEVEEVNRVVYDITHKPPATIEWE